MNFLKIEKSKITIKKFLGDKYKNGITRYCNIWISRVFVDNVSEVVLLCYGDSGINNGVCKSESTLLLRELKEYRIFIFSLRRCHSSTNTFILRKTEVYVNMHLIFHLDIA